MMQGRVLVEQQLGADVLAQAEERISQYGRILIASRLNPLGRPFQIGPLWRDQLNRVVLGGDAGLEITDAIDGVAKFLEKFNNLCIFGVLPRPIHITAMYFEE